MNDHDILNAITSHFASAFSLCGVEYQNVRLDKDSLTEWVRISVKPYDPKLINLKKGIMRRGAVYIQAFVKPDIGSGRAFELACSAAEIFENKFIGLIEFDAAETIDVGLSASGTALSSESGWYQVNAVLDYKAIV
jgi:hypothetical protein